MISKVEIDSDEEKMKEISLWPVNMFTYLYRRSQACQLNSKSIMRKFTEQN
jgi:hypothetical protein